MISPPRKMSEGLDHKGHNRFKSAPVVSRSLCPFKRLTRDKPALGLPEGAHRN